MQMAKDTCIHVHVRIDMCIVMKSSEDRVKEYGNKGVNHLANGGLYIAMNSSEDRVKNHSAKRVINHLANGGLYRGVVPPSW